MLTQPLLLIQLNVLIKDAHNQKVADLVGSKVTRAFDLKHNSSFLKKILYALDAGKLFQN